MNTDKPQEPNMQTQDENPKGLHQRYYIRKIVKRSDGDIEKEKEFYSKRQRHHQAENIAKYELKDVEKGAEYFVMRLDTGGSDIEHIKACRIGIHAYADAIEHHIPMLAKDLRERYPLI